MLLATRRWERFDDPQSFYGRIRDEFIILEEKELDQGVNKLIVFFASFTLGLLRNSPLLSASKRQNLQVTFVYEEFMEYVMARSLVDVWERKELSKERILKSIDRLTRKYDQFAQILGVMVYLSLMLKEQSDISLWSLLLTKGEKWQRVVFDAFRKLPDEQIDNSVLSSLEEMLRTNVENIQKQVLDLMKLEKIGRASSTSQSLVDLACELARHNKEPIARRAILVMEHIRIEKSLPILIHALQHSKGSVKKNANSALERMRTKSREHANEEALFYAIYYCIDQNQIHLGKLKTLGYEAVPHLTTMLKYNDWKVQEGAVKALEQLGDKRAVSALLEKFKDSNDNILIKRAVVHALGQLGDLQAVPTLIEALKDSDKDVRISAVQALQLLEGGEPAVAALREALKDSDKDMRIRVVQAFRQLKGEQAIAILVDTLEDGDKDVRISAVQALQELGGERTVATLVDVLKDSDKDVRISIVQALQQLGGERATAALSEMVKDSTRNVRICVIHALQQLGGERAVAALVEALKDNDKDVRISAVQALQTLSGKRLVPILSDELKDSVVGVQIRIVQALRQLIWEQAVAALSKAVKDKDENVRLWSVKALQQLGGEQAVVTLSDAVKDGVLGVRISAVQALQQLGGERAVAGLVEALKDSDSNVRLEAVRALRQLSKQRALFIPDERSQDSDKVVRIKIVQLLHQRLWEQVIAILAEVLKFDNDKDVRMGVVQALLELGGKRAVSAISEALKDSVLGVRISADQALRQLKL